MSDSGRSDSKRLSNAPDKQVTNGVVGSVISIAEILVLTQYVEIGFYATGSLKDSSSQRICSPGLFAGQKDSGTVPTADGEITMRATPEPAAAPAQGVGGEVTNATAGAADP